MVNEDIAPCGMCGSPVRERRVNGQMTLADITPPIEIVRVCTNPNCDSNTGSMTLADVV